MRLTRQGKNALAQALLGNELHFTRAAIGSGAFDYATESVFELEGLRQFEMWLPLVEAKVQGDGTVAVTAYLSNAEVVKGFACREHGLFCNDPLTGAEILYAYRNVGEDYDFIPANTGTAHKNINLSYTCEISDAANITAMLDLSVAYVSTADFRAHVESPHPHLNIPNHYSNVASTEAVWATDFDDHLHKISIEDLRRTLSVPAESTTTLNPADELGLHANLLYFEDFTGDEASDYFKTRVTSSAENGVLIGLEDIQQIRTGGTYVISDGTAAEEVEIASVLKNAGGYYAKLRSPLANKYTGKVYLYRSMPKQCSITQKTWQGEDFSGVNANQIRAQALRFEASDLRGGALVDGFFTL